MDINVFLNMIETSLVAMGSKMSTANINLASELFQFHSSDTN